MLSWCWDQLILLIYQLFYLLVHWCKTYLLRIKINKIRLRLHNQKPQNTLLFLFLFLFRYFVKLFCVSLLFFHFTSNAWNCMNFIQILCIGFMFAVKFYMCVLLLRSTSTFQIHKFLAIWNLLLQVFYFVQHTNQL